MVGREGVRRSDNYDPRALQLTMGVDVREE